MSCLSFKTEFSANSASFKTEFSANSASFDTDMGSYVGSNLDEFEGEYEFTSKIKKAQTFETKNKIMKNDIVIKEIPIYEVNGIITIG